MTLYQDGNDLTTVIRFIETVSLTDGTIVDGSVGGETFDVAGRTFSLGKYYEFTFDTPIALDANTPYAFQVWWTVEDNSHDIRWERADGDGVAPGGLLFSNGADLTFPFEDTTTAGQDTFDFVYALSVPEPATCIYLLLAGLGLFGHMRSRRTSTK